MRALVKKYKTSPTIYNLSRRIVYGLPQKDYLGEAKRVHQFVRDQIRYVKDIYGVETLQTPEKTLHIKQGDCDDKSTLAAALLESLGHPTRFLVVGPKPDHFVHVFPQVYIYKRWHTVECTEPWKFGEVRKKFPYARQLHR